MSQPDVFDLIAASGPFYKYAEKMMLYGQFVGSWKIDAIWYNQDGGQKRGKGQWHFGWILGGRGIQDVLFAQESPAHKYGTTLRCYDPDNDVWHITWMQPYSGEFVHLIGRKVGDCIIQDALATELARRERWSFAEISHNSFLWLGESSSDYGQTWFLEQEMRATRFR